MPWILSVGICLKSFEALKSKRATCVEETWMPLWATGLFRLPLCGSQLMEVRRSRSRTKDEEKMLDSLQRESWLRVICASWGGFSCLRKKLEGGPYGTDPHFMERTSGRRFRLWLERHSKVQLKSTWSMQPTGQLQTLQQFSASEYHCERVGRLQSTQSGSDPGSSSKSSFQ